MARRMTREQGLQWLQQPLARNEYGVNAQPSELASPGRFSWDAKHIYFSFYGNGTIHRIELERKDGEVADAETWAPGASRWAGALTEYAGDAHNKFRTTLWERRAWNTLNLWCLPRRFDNYTPILEVIKFAEAAWARIVDVHFTWYFLPPPGKQRPEALRFYVASVGRTAQNSYVDAPAFRMLKAAQPEQLAYLAVAWDEFEETGKPTTRLMGTSRSK